MAIATESIPARDVVDDILPKLASLQSFVDHTLTNSIRQQNSPEQRRQEESLKNELEMELTIIRMNIDHLMKRYEATFSRLGVSRQVCSPSVELDQAEATAIERLRQLHQRTRRLYADT
ncbi:hypothetical protein [Onishia taeanensis]